MSCKLLMPQGPSLELADNEDVFCCGVIDDVGSVHEEAMSLGRLS